MSLNDVEQNLQQFVMQLDNFSETVRRCGQELAEPMEEVTSQLPLAKANSYRSLSAELDVVTNNLTHTLIPGLKSGLEYRMHVLRVYLHE